MKYALCSVIHLFVGSKCLTLERIPHAGFCKFLKEFDNVVFAIKMFVQQNSEEFSIRHSGSVLFADFNANAMWELVCR